LELRSVASAPVPVVMADIFPPDPPTGLVAVPGYLSPGDQNPASTVAAQPKPTVDLSWQPSTAPRIAGYHVYRSETPGGQNPGPTSRLTPSPVTSPAYRDLTVAGGHTYLYRVTAIDTTGNESQPSAPATETAPTP